MSTPGGTHTDCRTDRVSAGQDKALALSQCPSSDSGRQKFLPATVQSFTSRNLCSIVDRGSILRLFISCEIRTTLTDGHDRCTAQIAGWQAGRSRPHEEVEGPVMNRNRAAWSDED